MHAHVFVNEAWPLVKDLPQVDRAMANLGASPMAIDAATMDRRFREMDRQGIDVHVISVHPSQFLYFTETGSGRAHREDAEREDRGARGRASRIASSASATSRCSSRTSRSSSSSTP